MSIISDANWVMDLIRDNDFIYLFFPEDDETMLNKNWNCDYGNISVDYKKFLENTPWFLGCHTCDTAFHVGMIENGNIFIWEEIELKLICNGLQNIPLAIYFYGIENHDASQSKIYECPSIAATVVDRCSAEEDSAYEQKSWFWEKLYDFLTVCREHHLPVNIPLDVEQDQWGFASFPVLSEQFDRGKSTAHVHMSFLQPIPENYKFPKPPFGLYPPEHYGLVHPQGKYAPAWRTLSPDEPLPFSRELPPVYKLYKHTI